MGIKRDIKRDIKMFSYQPVSIIHSHVRCVMLMAGRRPVQKESSGVTVRSETQVLDQI